LVKYVHKELQISSVFINKKEGVMDTSSEYITMCEKATEIMNKWHYKFGDFYVSLVAGIPSEAQTIVSDLELHSSYMHQIKAVWLPRQDQLQALILDQYATPWDLVIEFANTLMSDKASYFDRFPSMEQIWIAYIMDKKFNKKWTGTDWL
jgi:hypothetical protein